MKAITLTEPIARAVAQDAANRQMRERCRKTGEPHVWSLDNYNLACETLDRIWFKPLLEEQRKGAQQ